MLPAAINKAFKLFRNKNKVKYQNSICYSIIKNIFNFKLLTKNSLLQKKNQPFRFEKKHQIEDKMVFVLQFLQENLAKFSC